MKVINISDVATPQLKQHGLVNATIEVNGAMLAPGASVDCPDNQMQRSKLQHVLSVGVATIGDPPQSYVDAKAKGSTEPVVANPPMSRRSRSV